MNELLEASTKQLTKHLEKGNITENEIALSKILDELSQLQQEKEDLIKWLEERVVDKEEDMKIARDGKNKQFIYGMLIAYTSVLEKLGE